MNLKYFKHLFNILYLLVKLWVDDPESDVSTQCYLTVVTKAIGLMFFTLFRCFLGLLFKLSKCITSNIQKPKFRSLPPGFVFGVSTSAYQIEEAWNEDGKSESIWDHLLYNYPDMDKESANGDVRADSYNLYKRDIEPTADFYRFSISWPRILPTSFTTKINPAAITYYNKVINELLKNNIKPMVTLYDRDLPQKLQDLGGWTNPNIVEWFADYARIAFQLFGDRVKHWITINEPYQICNLGYGDINAPALNMKRSADYMCNKYVLLAHAKVYHIYDKEFRTEQQGSIFISINAEWFDSDPQVNDSQAADVMNQFWWGMYAHPIFSKNGDDPQIIKDIVDKKSAEQGFYRSRLLPLTAEEVDSLRGTSDLFGLNHYSTYYLYRNKSVVGYYEVPSLNDDVGVSMYQQNSWILGDSEDVKHVPQCFYKLLRKIRNDYINPPVFITENGFSTNTGLNDVNRVTYIKNYLNAISDAIDEGSDIRGYTYWSLMNNYQWLKRYDLLLSHILIPKCKTIETTSHQDVRKFPEGFLFGTATAAYQVEGAWDADGKTENIWDHLTHNNPCVVADCSNGDIAENSYYLYKRDVEMMRELGIDFYRFSLSWTRILPTSFPDKINQAGVNYYNNLINEMLKYNIKPMISLFHWDLPQKLQKMGGWANPHIVDWFGDYARIAYGLFGDRVKLWITINEPYEICRFGYGGSLLAPALNITGVAEYMCAKNLLLAHARAYHIYDKEFRPSQSGSIFITLSGTWHEPETENDVTAAEEANQFHWAQYSHPIFSESGDFPPIMKERIAAKSASQGFPRSRLPEFTPEEVDYVRGSSDLFGLNHYSSSYAYRNQSVVGYYDSPSFDDDVEVMTYQLNEWKIGESEYTKFVPWGFYKLLTKIREDYGNPPVYITENGFATHGGLQDDDRITYYRYYLDALLDAVEDGSDIRAYTAWSLMDNFEWLAGYTERFGLYEVDYESPARTRTPRKSAFVYKHIVRTRALDLHYEPDTTEMTIDQGR